FRQGIQYKGHNLTGFYLLLAITELLHNVQRLSDKRRWIFLASHSHVVQLPPESQESKVHGTLPILTQQCPGIQAISPVRSSQYPQRDFIQSKKQIIDNFLAFGRV